MPKQNIRYDLEAIGEMRDELGHFLLPLRRRIGRLVGLRDNERLMAIAAQVDLGQKGIDCFDGIESTAERTKTGLRMLGGVSHATAQSSRRARTSELIRIKDGSVGEIRYGPRT